MRGPLVLLLTLALALPPLAAAEGERCAADLRVEREGDTWELNLTWSPVADATFLDVYSRVDNGTWTFRARTEARYSAMGFGSEPRGWNEYAVAVDGAFDAVCPTAAILVTWGPDPAKPELWVYDVDFNGTFQAGSDGEFGAYVGNDGPATQTDVVVRFELDGALLGETVVPAGLTGIRRIGAPERWVATEGEHFLLVTVDPANAVDEPREDNNALGWTSGVAPPPPPPPPARQAIFAWYSVDGAYTSLSTNDITLPTGMADVWFDLRCTSSSVKVFLDGMLVATCTQGVRTGTWPYYLPAGEHRIGVAYAGVDSASLVVSGIPW